MKELRLNPDCVRDILLTVEELSGPSKKVAIPNPEQKRLVPYEREELQYHILQCDAANLICGVKPFSKGRYLVQDLTPKGHEFLANVREQSIWNKTKETAASVGSYSLTALAQIAAGIIQSVITFKFTV